MTQLFSNNTYYKAFVKQQPDFNEEEFRKSLSSNIKREYGNVSLADFTKEYSSEGWLGRKVGAVPGVLLGTVVTVSVVAVLGFVTVASLLSSHPGFSKLRDLGANLAFRAGELTTGCLIMLFNDRVGMFLVQEADFHVRCAQVSFKSVEPYQINVKLTGSRRLENAIDSLRKNGRVDTFSGTSTNGGPFIPDMAQATTLLDMRNAEPEMREKVIQAFGLEEKVKDVEQQIGKTFEAFLKETPEYFLRNLSLEEFYLSNDQSNFLLAAYSDNEFGKMTLEFIKEKFHYEDQVNFMMHRAAHQFKDDPVDLGPEHLKERPIEQLPFAELFRLNAAALMAQEGVSRRHALALVRNEQLKGIKLIGLEADDLVMIFKGCKTDVEFKARIAAIEVAEMRQALKDGKLQGKVLCYLSEEHLKGLKLSELQKKQVYDLFNLKLNNKSIALDRNKLELFNLEDIQQAIVKGILIGEYELHLLTDTHLQSLELSKLSKDRVRELFTPQFNKEKIAEERRRFALLNQAEVQQALENGVLRGEYQLRLLSDKHLQSLELSKLSKNRVKELFTRKFNKDEIAEERRRFALLNQAEVQQANDCGILGTYPLKMLWDERAA